MMDKINGFDLKMAARKIDEHTDSTSVQIILLLMSDTMNVQGK